MRRSCAPSVRRLAAQKRPHIPDVTDKDGESAEGDADEDEEAGQNVKRSSVGGKEEGHQTPDVVQRPPPDVALTSWSPHRRCQEHFAVVYAKRSNRKNIIWTNDGIVCVTGDGVALLMDAENPRVVIGRSSKWTPFVGGTDCAEGQLSFGQWTVQVACRMEASDLARISQGALGCAEHEPHKKVCNKPYKMVQGPTRSDDALSSDDEEPFVLKCPEGVARDENMPVTEIVVDRFLAKRLRPHQKEGVEFLFHCIMGWKEPGRFGAILADEMGLGKSLQCICLLWTLMKPLPTVGRPLVRRVLIVCPCTLLRNWEQELRKWLGGGGGGRRLMTFVVDARSDVARLLPVPPRSVVVVGYEKLRRSVERFRTAGFDLLICDEGHRLKNAAVTASLTLSQLPTRRRLLLTATPIQNNLRELFALIDFVNPGRLGAAAAFRDVYERPILAALRKGAAADDVAVGRLKLHQLSRVLSTFLLRRGQDVMRRYLPPKAEYVVFCWPSPLQTALYSHLTDKALAADDLYDHERFLVYLDAFRKACNHPSLLHFAAQARLQTKTADSVDSLYKSVLPLFPRGYDPTVLSVGDASKLHVLASILEEILVANQKEKVVIASNFTQTLNILAAYCDSVGYAYYRLDGAVSQENRQRLVNNFNDPVDRTPIFLLSTKSGGVGLNLIGAARIVLYDIDWNPMYDIQAMARIWRDGQTKTCHVYRLLTAGTVEERMYIRQINKQELNCVVDEFVNANLHGVNFSEEEIRDLCTFENDTDCITHNLLNCCCCGAGSAPSQSEGGTEPSSSEQAERFNMTRMYNWQHIGPHRVKQALGRESGLHNCDSVSFVFYNLTE